MYLEYTSARLFLRRGSRILLLLKVEKSGKRTVQNCSHLQIRLQQEVETSPLSVQLRCLPSSYEYEMGLIHYFIREAHVPYLYDPSSSFETREMSIMAKNGVPFPTSCSLSLSAISRPVCILVQDTVGDGSPSALHSNLTLSPSRTR